MTKANECTCPSGDGSLRHPCPAHIGPFDKLVGSPVHNESEPDLPPLDEHLAQVFETGMALSESVEQAGGDERDLQAEGAQGELLPCPFCGGQAHLTYDDYVHDDLRPMPVVECNACHTWVRAESWNKRAALAQPSPAQPEGAPVIGCLCGMPMTEGHHSPDGCCNLEDFAPQAQAEKAEAERPEVVAWRYGFSGGIVSDKACLDEWKSGGEYQSLMTVAQHERIVKAWIERWKAYIELSAKIAAQRDAALAEVERLTRDRDDCLKAREHYATQLGAALARVAELERGKVYVEARRCDECQHGGINDSATGVAACHECDWTGPEPEEDKCPGCQRENCMAAACPQCGARYVLVASEEIAAPVAQAQHSVPDGWRIERSAERIVVMNLNNGAGYAAARDGESGIAESVLYLLAADLLAAAPGKEGA